MTNSGSRQCTYCPQYAWKWFPSLAATFLGMEVRLTVLRFPISTFCRFLWKSCANCWLLPLFAASVTLVLTQASVLPISYVWPTAVPCLAHLLPSWFCKSHSHPSQLSVYEQKSPRLFPCKEANASTWPIQQLQHAQLLVYWTFMLKS